MFKNDTYMKKYHNPLQQQSYEHALTSIVPDVQKYAKQHYIALPEHTMGHIFSKQYDHAVKNRHQSYDDEPINLLPHEEEDFFIGTLLSMNDHNEAMKKQVRHDATSNQKNPYSLGNEHELRRGTAKSNVDWQAIKNPRARKTIQKILESEGGFVNHPNDPGGKTNHGITQNTLDLLNKHHNMKDKGLPKHVGNLTPADSVRIQNEYFIPHLQLDKLEAATETVNPKLSDNKEVDKLYHNILDAGFNHQEAVAGKLLQQSLDEIDTSGHLKRRNKENGIEYYDGIIGTKTRNKIERIINDGKLSDLNEAIKQKRIEYIRNNTEPDFQNGVIDRVNKI